MVWEMISKAKRFLSDTKESVPLNKQEKPKTLLSGHNFEISETDIVIDIKIFGGLSPESNKNKALEISAVFPGSRVEDSDKSEESNVVKIPKGSMVSSSEEALKILKDDVFVAKYSKPN